MKKDKMNEKKLNNCQELTRDWQFMESNNSIILKNNQTAFGIIFLIIESNKEICSIENFPQFPLNYME